MKTIQLFAATSAMLAVIATTGVAQEKGKGKGGGIQLPPMINIKVADYADGGRIPNKYTCAAGQGSPRCRGQGQSGG